MAEQLPRIFLARHGETSWSLTGQHTGRADIPLTPHGEDEARRLGERLAGMNFALVLTSPLQRARRTCELCGYGSMARLEPNLMEWSYGAYEGRTRADIHKDRPGWDLFRDGCPQGESLADVGVRADRLVAHLRGLSGDALLFGHGHILRVLAARWLGMAPADAVHYWLATASVSTLGYEHDRDHPVIRLWNDVHHLGIAQQ